MTDRLELTYPRARYSPYATVTKPGPDGVRTLMCLACGWTRPTEHTNVIRALNDARKYHPETDCIARKPK